VYAFDVDKDLQPVLAETLAGLDNVEVIFRDFNKLDLKEFEKEIEEYTVVANLPYYITTPLVTKLLEESDKVQGLSIMVQEEVAERFCAKENTAEYGSITAAIALKGSAKIVKRVSTDPKFNSELIAHLIRVLMRDGKKTTAERIVYGAIDKISEDIAKNPGKYAKDAEKKDDSSAVTDPLEVVSMAIENMKPKVEVKTRRVGGTTYPVPTEIKEVRQLSLALRWMKTYAGGRRGMGMAAAVAAEIIDAFQGQGNVIKKRDDVHKMAAANKAFAHFAW
jgi:small subunit ribosomal protein S7